MSDDDLMRIFKAVDRDGSGDIDAAEFTEWVHKNSVRCLAELEAQSTAQSLLPEQRKN